jgi:hypothetical protein
MMPASRSYVAELESRSAAAAGSITKVGRDGEIGAPAKHVEKATKGCDNDKIGLLCSPGHRPTPPPSFDHRLVLRGEKAVTSTTTGGDAGAGLGSAGGARAFLRYTFQAAPLLEQCNVLVVSHRLIQGREAVRSVAIAAAVPGCPPSQ